MYEVTFRVNLLHSKNTFQSQDQILDVTNTKTIYIPVNNSGTVVRYKHNDVFVLSGKEAIYLKNLIVNSGFLNVEVFEIPPVRNLQLVEGEESVVTVTWDSGNQYFIEFYYREDEGEWQFELLAPGTGSKLITSSPGVELEVKLRLTDNRNNYSVEYTEDQITLEETEEEIYFSLPSSRLFALSDVETNEMNENSIYIVSDGEEDTLFARMLPARIGMSGVSVAWSYDDDLMYVLYARNSEDTNWSDTLYFESVDIISGVRTEISIDEMEWPSSLTFTAPNFIASANNVLYNITSSGDVNSLNTLDRTFSAMVYSNGILYGMDGDQIYHINVVTGEYLEDEEENIIVSIIPEITEVISVDSVRSATVVSHETDVIFKIVASYINSEEETSGYVMLDVNITQNTVSGVDYMEDGVTQDIFYGESNVLYGFTSDELSVLAELEPLTVYRVSDLHQMVKLGFIEYDASAAIAWNSNDGYIYHIADRVLEGSEEED